MSNEPLPSGSDPRSIRHKGVVCKVQYYSSKAVYIQWNEQSKIS
jgi:hypothetical protein